MRGEVEGQRAEEERGKAEMRRWKWARGKQVMVRLAPNCGLRPSATLHGQMCHESYFTGKVVLKGHVICEGHMVKNNKISLSVLNGKFPVKYGNWEFPIEHRHEIL